MATLRLRIGGAPFYYNTVVDADSPLSHWKLGETVGTLAEDRKGNRHGTYVGAPTLSATPLVVRSRGDRAAEFDGVDDRVTTTRDAALDFTGTAPFSVEAWIRPSVWDSNLRYVCGQADATHGYALIVTDTATNPRTVRLERRVSGIAAIAQVSNLTLQTGYSVLGVYTGTELRIYVNGALTIGDPDSRTMPSQTGFFCIGDRSV